MSPRQPPIDQPTRGKTARNRLRRVDIFISRYDPALIKQETFGGKQALYIDLGFGAEPATTLESARRFQQMNPDLITLGVEIDPERVAAALAHQTPQILFRQGGFKLPLQENETVRLIRAFNVLRQYPVDKFTPAIELMVTQLIPGGLLVEGTSDPYERVWCANLIRAADQNSKRYEAITFSTSFRDGFDPAHLQPVLPKNLINQMGTSTVIRAFFEAWKDAALKTISFKQYGLRQWFVEAAHRLAEAGYKLDLRKKMLKSGFLTWKYPPLEL